MSTNLASSYFANDLAQLGPGVNAAAPSLEASQAYCRNLAKSHYENFQVASWLLPRELRQHFHNVYAYCRWSDNLADEVSADNQSLTLLDWWEEELRACFHGEARHPVFVALRETIQRFQVPKEPFADLLVAFRQDRSVSRYETMAELIDYCRYSANPVGRIVLYLAECRDEESFRLSDFVCTGLQLANFCQDVAGDWDRGRIYIPQEDCRRYGYDEAMFARREVNDAFRLLMAANVGRAEELLRSGLPLVPRVSRPLRIDIWLFIQGGLAILEKIRRARYDVWRARPKVSRSDQLGLFAKACWRRLRGNWSEAP